MMEGAAILREVAQVILGKMTNDQIKKVFERNMKKTNYFKNWLGLKVCTIKEIKRFNKWLNQLSEEEICSYLKKDGTILLAIKNQTVHMCKIAIQNDPFSIEFIKDQTKEICELSIKNFPRSIHYIKEQTVDLCLLALEKNPYTYQHVRIVSNPDHETTLKNLKEKKALLEALK